MREVIMRYCKSYGQISLNGSFSSYWKVEQAKLANITRAENIQKSFYKHGTFWFFPSSASELRWASPGPRAFSVMREAWRRSRRIPALLGYFHRIARLNMQFRWKTRKRRLQPFVLFDDKSYTRKVHPLWIPQTSQWFLSTYREGALPALLQGVSLIKATILEKQNWMPWRRSPAPLTASQCIGVFIFLTTLTWAASSRHRYNLLAPSQLHCESSWEAPDCGPHMS